MNKYKDFKECMLAIGVNLQGSAQERLEWIFSAYDVDNNGHIDREELKKILKVCS